MYKIIVAACLALALCGSVSAQKSMGFELYGGGGVNFPMSDANTYWKAGINGTLGIGFHLTPGLEGVARFAFNKFATDNITPESMLEDTITNINEDLEIYEYGFDLRANLGSPRLQYKPYGLIGVGIASLPNESKFCYSVGGGFKVTVVPQTNIFIEARYTVVTAEDIDISYVPITAGINISF